MKRVSLSILTLFFIINIQAQKLELGFIGSYQHTNSFAFVGGDVNKINFNPKSGPGFNIGGYLGWNMYKNFGLDIQVLYAMRYYSFNMQYMASNTSIIYKRSVFNVEFPIHLNYRFKVNEKISISPVLGVSLNIGVHGKDIAYENTPAQKPITKETENDNLFGKDGRMPRFEAAPEVGVLLKYKNFGFRALYAVGVMNLTKPTFGWTFYLPEKQSKYLFNRELKLSFIYTFHIK